MSGQAQDGAANLVQLWEEHIRHEFSTRSTDDTLKTMVEDAYLPAANSLIRRGGRRIRRSRRQPA